MYIYKFTNTKLTAQQIAEIERFLQIVGVIDDCNLIGGLATINTEMQITINTEIEATKFDVVILYLQEFYKSYFTLLESNNNYADWYAADITLNEVLFNNYEELELAWEDEITILDDVTEQINYFAVCKETTKHLTAKKESVHEIIENEGNYNLYVS